MSQHYLKYGDHLVLSSAETTTNQFLVARSQVEKKVKVITENNRIDERLQSLDLSLYPNISELVFQVVPSQSFDALNQLQLVDKDDQRYALIERRVISEQMLNETEKARLNGQVVRYGDKIQLFHELTSTFIVFTSERKQYQNIFAVGLSEEFSAETHFQVNPYENLKREGDPVTYHDMFSLMCPENFHSLGFLEQERQSYAFKEQKKTKVNFSDNLEEGKDQTFVDINLDDLPQISNLPTCENLGLFNIEDCFCTNLNTAREIEAIEHKISFSGAVKAFPVHYTPQQDRSILRYGDFVRIRQPTKEGHEGFLACEDNYAGFSPEILYRQYTNRTDYSCELHFSSIFQIVPRNIQDFGAPVTFDDNNKTQIHFRHFLTSKLLHIDNDTRYLLEPASKNSDAANKDKDQQRESVKKKKKGKKRRRRKREYNYDDNNNNGGVGGYGSNGNQESGEFSRPHLSMGFNDFTKKWLKNSKNTKDFLTLQFEDEENMTEMRKHKLRNKAMTQACVDAYFDRFSITLSKDDSVESKRLTIEDILSLNSRGKYSLKVSQEFNLNSSSIYDKTCTFYNPCFHKLSIGIFSTNFVQIVNNKNGGAFSLEHVRINDIQKAVLFSSMLSPLIKIIDEKCFSEETIYLAKNSITELLNLMKNKEAELEGDEVLYSDIQDAYRDLSVLDICIKFYYYYLHFGLKNNKDYESLLNRISYFLEKCCKDNKLNSYYLFQWNQMYISIVLNNMWRSAQLLNEKCTIDIDRVISSILSKKEFNSIVAKQSVPQILRTMEFENYEIKRLRLLADIFQSTSIRDLNLLKQIQTEILANRKFNVLFRPFFEKDGKFYIRVEDDVIVDLQRLNKDTKNIENKNNSRIYTMDPNISNISDIKGGDSGQKDLLILDYIEKTIFLAIELCKGYATVFESRYRQFLPEILCVKMIQCEELPFKLRAQFVRFFKEAYLESRCKDFRKVNLPQLLWFLSEEEKANADVHLYNLKMEILVKMYLQNRSGLALVPYIIKFIRDPENFNNIEVKLPLLSAFLELFQFLIERDFIDFKVVTLIKISLFQFIKNLTSKNVAKLHSNDAQNSESGLSESGFLGASSKFGKSSILSKSRVKIKLDQVELRREKEKATLLLEANSIFEDEELTFLNLALHCLEVIENMRINVKINDIIYEKKWLPLFKNLRITEKTVEKLIPKKRIIAAIDPPPNSKLEDIYKSFIYIQKKKEQGRYLMAQKLEEKEENRKKMLDDLGRDFPKPSSHYSYLLIDMICTEELKVSESALRILVKQYQFRTTLMKTIPFVQLVVKDNMMNRLHGNFITVYNEIVHEQNRLNKLILQNASNDDILARFDNINRSLTDLTRDLVVSLGRQDGPKLKARQLYVDGLFRVPNLNDLNINPRPGYFINVFNHFYLDLANFDLKQILLKNMGFIDVVFELLSLIYHIELGVRQNEGLSKPFFEEFVLKDEDEELEKQQLVSREICLKCTTILFYCAFNNGPNQLHIQNLISKNKYDDFLFPLFMKQRSTTFSRHFFNLMTQVYGTNLQLLLKLPQNETQLIPKLMSSFAEAFDEREITPYILYLFTSMRSLTTYKGMNIFRNNIYILKQFLGINSKNRRKIFRFFETILPDVLEDTNIQTQKFEGGFPSLLKIDSSYDVTFLEIPIEIAFAVQFLRFFSEIGAGIPESLLQELQVLLPLNVITKMLTLPHMWHSLRRELYIYVTSIYLLEDMDDTDWSIISKQMVQVAAKDLERLAYQVEKYETSEAKVFYIFDFDQYPGNSIVEGTNSPYIDLMENSEIDLLRSTISKGIIPFFIKFVDSIKVTGSPKEIVNLKAILGLLSSESSQSSKFQSIYNSTLKGGDGRHKSLASKMRKIEGNIEVRKEDNGYDDFNQSDQIDICQQLKAKIQYKIKYKTALYQSYAHTKKDTTFFGFGDGQNINELSIVSYYRYDLEYPDPSAVVGHADFNYSKKFNLYDDIMGPEHYDQLKEEDRSSLMMMIIGIRAESKKKFNLFLKILLSILDYEFNDKEDKINALYILKRVVEAGRDFNIQIMEDLIEMNIVEILCKLLIKNYKDFRFSGHSIVMILRVLQEVEEEIQDSLYKYLTHHDIKNQFVQAVVLYLESSFQGLLSSEALREEVVSSLGGEEDLEKDKVLVERESIRYMEQTQNCLEMLRLMCENHYEKMQNFLRVQVNSKGVVRYNSVNVILKVSKILKDFVNKIDAFNAPVVETIFDFFIEILQGPCADNQRQVCNSLLLETAEDLLINMSRVSRNELDIQTGNQSNNPHENIRSTHFGSKRLEGANRIEESISFLKNQYIVSSLIEKITTFMSAVIEATEDKIVISKMTVHIQIDVMVDRLKSIYELFQKDIEKKSLRNFGDKGRIGSKSKGGGGGLDFQTTLKAMIDPNNSQDQKLMDEFSEIKSLHVLVDRDEEKDREFNPIIMEGLKIWILIKSVASLDPDFNNNFHQAIQEIEVNEPKISKIVKFFDSKVSSIEIINMLSNLQTIFFPIQPLTRYLSDYSKNNFSDVVPRDIASDKLRFLMESFPDFYREMMHFQSLNVKGVKVNLTYFSYLKWISLTLVVTANLLQLASDPAPSHSYTLKWTEIVIQGCAFLIMIIYIIIFVLWLIFNARLDYEKIAFSKRGEFEKIKEIDSVIKRGIKKLEFSYNFLVDYFTTSYLLDLTMNLIFVFLTIFVSRIFISLMLLDIVFRFELLKNVVRAIGYNTKQMFMTSLLGLAILNIYASIGYFTPVSKGFIFIEAPDYILCNSHFLCFLSIMGFGLRSGGGIGDVLRYPDYETELGLYMASFVFDFTFFVVVILIFFNIVSGFIIDTFGDLREKKTRDDFDRNMICFICNIQKTVFVKNGINFKQHRHSQHNEWDYINFLAHIQEVDENDLNGLESYVFEKVQDDDITDISWIPIGQAMILKQTEYKQQENIKDIFFEFLERLKVKALTILGSEIDNVEVVEFIDKLEVQFGQLSQKLINPFRKFQY